MVHRHEECQQHSILIAFFTVLLISSTVTNLRVFIPFTSHHLALAQVAQGQQNVLTYSNSKYQISIQYPSDWEVKEKDDSAVNNLGSNGKNIVTFIPPNSTDNSGYVHNYFALNIDNKPGNDLGNFLSNAMPSGLKGLQILESNTNATLAGQPAYTILYTDSETFDSKTMEIGTVNGDKGYYVDYQADPGVYDTYLPTIYKMLSSLQTPFGQGGEALSTTAGQQSSLPPSTQQQSSPPQTFFPYHNAFYGVTMKYPTNWNITSFNPTHVTFDSPGSRLNHRIAEVQINIGNFPSATNQTTYMNGYINSLRNDTSYQNLQIFEKNMSATLAGQPAFKLVFTARNPNLGINYKTMVIGTIIGSKEYSIYSTAFSDQFSTLLPTMQAMSDSFLVQNETGSAIQYQNPNLGFTIGYPNNWTLSERPNDITFSPKPHGPPSTSVDVNVTTNNSLQNISSQYNYNKLLEMRNNLAGFHLIDENDTILSGYPGHYFLFTFSANSTQLEGLTEYSIVGSREYELRFISTIDNFDNLLNYLIPNMESSFGIFQQQPAGPSSSNSLCIPGFHCE